MASTVTRPHRIRDARGHFLERMRRGDSYGFLLALILVGYVVIALLERSLWERFAISVVMGVVFLVTLHTSQIRGRAFRIGVLAVVFVCLSTFLQALVGRHGNDG